MSTSTVTDRPAPELRELRTEVRRFLAAAVDAGVFTPRVNSWLTGWDESFSRTLAERGWVGMTVPAGYGGHGRSHLERFAVTGELLAAGAPIAAHWIADRQIAPSILRYGTEEQKRYYLPRIASGGYYFGLGMSEPDAGSDLASVRTRAVRVDGGWQLTGTKVWTSGAHRAHALVVLARTATDPDDRHAGLSQFVVELGDPRIQVRPIMSMNGEHHFNEVVLDEAFVPDAGVLGTVGNGWTQVTSELAFERSGPERLLSTYPLLQELVAATGRGSVPADARIGRLVARTAALHRMSADIAETLARGDSAAGEAALVKLLGTRHEGDIADVADTLAGGLPPDREPALQDHVRTGLLEMPGFTLRGGSNEVLQGIVARRIGVRR
ncbi:acyl-CoA dehydrogenase family protein [Pseudonocardia kongjuensis]|uniref:Acyl-CoA dehydrogenase family protein n=1 Tax=Pseudonocardia kongjuensis TaxID=102227 RepID=A0ABN1XZC9_9PSEU